MSYRDHPARDYSTVATAPSQLVDVRRLDEFRHGSLPGFSNIPLDDLPQRLDELDRDRRVVLLCRSGNRSAIAARFLAAEGFGDVVNLSGGMLDAGATS